MSIFTTQTRTALVFLLNETTTLKDINEIVKIIAKSEGKVFTEVTEINPQITIPQNLSRTSTFLTNTVFNSYHSETEMMRYIKRLRAQRSFVKPFYDFIRFLYYEAKRGL